LLKIIIILKNRNRKRKKKKMAAVAEYQESVFAHYDLSNEYSNNVKFYPNIWGNSYESFIPPMFALYFEAEKRFVLFKFTRIGLKFKVENSFVNRDEPFYLKVTGSPFDFQDGSYNIPLVENRSVTLWFANAWLCKKNGVDLNALIPIMHVSNYYPHFTFLHSASHKVYENIIDYDKNKEYINNYTKLTPEYIMSIILSSKKIPFDVICSSEEETIISHVKPIPTYISEIIIENAINKKQTCPITLDEITKDSACVTSCFHVFDKEALTIWLKDKKNNSCCPLCKQKCVM
jgi:hypothetical protein